MTTDAILGTVLVTATYLVQVQAVDTIGMESTVTITVPTDSVFMHRTPDSMSLGKYSEKPKMLDSAWSINTDGDFTAAGNAVIGGTMSAADIGRIGYYRNLDFDTLTKQTGYYADAFAPSAAGCSNYPVDATGMLCVIAYDGVFAYQTYQTYNGYIYTRSYYVGSGWTVWKQVQLI